MALGFCQAFPAGFCELGMDKHGIAGQNRFSKFHLISTHKITDAAGGLRQFEQQDARDLRHCFDLHHAGHHGMTREMPLEKWFIDCDSFHAHTFCLGFEADNAIDHQEGKTVR